MGDVTVSGPILVGAITALCGVIVYLHKESEIRHDKEMERVVKFYEARVADVKALAIRSTDVTEKAVASLTGEQGTR